MATTMWLPTGLITQRALGRAEGTRLALVAERRNAEHHGRGWDVNSVHHSRRCWPADGCCGRRGVDRHLLLRMAARARSTGQAETFSETHNSVGPRLTVGQRDNTTNTNYTGIVNHSGGKISLSPNTSFLSVGASGTTPTPTSVYNLSPAARSVSFPALAITMASMSATARST